MRSCRRNLPNRQGKDELTYRLPLRCQLSDLRHLHELDTRAITCFEVLQSLYIALDVTLDVSVGP